VSFPIADWTQRLRTSLTEIPSGRVALLLSVGLVLGVFPIMGIPTILCLLAAVIFRLNPAALQVLNSVTSPLQLALLLPLARIGSKLCGVNLAGGAWTAKLGLTALCAVAGWAFVCFPLGALLYAGLSLITPPGDQDRPSRRNKATAQTQRAAEAKVSRIIQTSKCGDSATARQMCSSVINPKITAVIST
jgi:hypothetical protein